MRLIRMNQKYKPRGLHAKQTGLMNFSDYKKKRHVFDYWALVTLLIIFVIVALTPILWLFVSSFKAPNEVNAVNYTLFPKEWNFQQFVEIWQKCGLTDVFLNTFVVVIGAVICGVVFNSLLAYAVAILKPIGYKVIHVMVLLAYMIPSALAIYPLVRAIDDVGLLGTYVPLWFVYGANAYYYMLFKNYFEKMPASLIEAAKIDGLGNLKIFFKVVLPLARPIIGVVAIFAMTAAYSDYLLPYMVIGNLKSENWTLMVAIYNYSSDPLVAPHLLQLLVLSIIPQVVIFVIFQKQIMNTSVNSGMKE